MSFKDQIVAMLARPGFQPLIDRFVGYGLRLKGFNNFPPEGGALGDGGEAWFIEKYLSHRNAVCLDVGANRGDFAECLLTRTPATVISVEPNPEMARQALHKNQRFGDRFRIVEKAISNRRGTAALKFSPTQTQTATLSDAVTSHAYHGTTTVDVEVTTIDDLVSELGLSRLDYIKIDVEGLELQCLESAAETLRTLRPEFIQLEMHWHHIFTGSTVFGMSQLLPAYKPFRLLPRSLLAIDPRSTFDNIFAYSNLIFRHTAP